MNPSVAALLVSHDGGRWLPAVIEGLRGQRVPVDQVVAVDTDSRDGSAELVSGAFGAVVAAPGSTSYPAAVRLGLEHVGDCDWVWLLHDDANPGPGALEALLTAAAADPGADILGPKLREWPSLRRLLELGVTISGTGRRETGLERGEYDQGQHDEVRQVLAVNTAGMLVRRTVLEQLGGFDTHLPIFGNDIDFGWRAAAAGHRTLIVPQAVVFHAEAAHRGIRRTPITGRHTHYQERRAALFTLLANAPARWLPFQVVRLGLGTLLRIVGLLLVRQVGQALDELAALVSLYSSPGELLEARRDRRERRAEEPADVRHLLAPRWLPYRHGLDVVSDLAAAATNQAADVAERRRAAAAPASHRRPLGVEDEDDLAEDTGLVARFLTSPVALGVALFVVLALVGAREAFGSVSGGALSAAPVEARDWWQLHVATWHPLGQGTALPAPAYVLPMAVLASLLGGSPVAAVSVLLALAVPFCLWGAWRFLRVAGRLVAPDGAPVWLLAVGAATYALVPVATGAWGEGRFGVVAVAATLPWLAHAALGFADPDADRRWRAAWRSGLLLALGTAFAPLLWWCCVLLVLVVLGAAFALMPGVRRSRATWGPPTVAVGVVPVLLAPWWLPAVLAGAAPALVLDAGRMPMASLDVVDLATGRFGDAGAPWWLGVVLAGLAALALLPARTRVSVLMCWLVALVAGLVAAVAGLFSFGLAATTTPPGLGFTVVALQAAFVGAAFLGGLSLVRRGGGPWRRVLGVGLAVVALLVPLGGLVWFVAGSDELQDDPDSGIPAYMMQNAMSDPARGILVVRGNVAEGLEYSVVRDDGVTLGEDEVVALAPEDDGLTRDIRTLVAAPAPDVVSDLAAAGIEYVVLRSPADGYVASRLDATGGLTQASAEDRSTRAWQVDAPVDRRALDGPRSWLRVGLLVVQGFALVVVVVLCVPSARREGS